MPDVTWVAENRSERRRSEIDPHARRGFDDVNLAWLRKHATGVFFTVRWGEGPSATEGQWKSKDFGPDPLPSLADLKTFAALIAAQVTPWEVEVTMRARVHGNSGYSYGELVWTYGHAKRNTQEARTLRGEN